MTPFVVTSTTTYGTAIDGTNTIFVVEPLDTNESQEEPEGKPMPRFYSWTEEERARNAPEREREVHALNRKIGWFLACVALLCVFFLVKWIRDGITRHDGTFVWSESVDERESRLLAEKTKKEHEAVAEEYYKLHPEARPKPQPTYSSNGDDGGGHMTAEQRRWVVERFRKEGMNTKDANTAADAVDKFHAAQQRRRGR